MESGNGNRKQVVLPPKEHEYFSVILERIAMERCLDGTSTHVTSSNILSTVTFVTTGLKIDVLFARTNVTMGPKFICGS